MSSIALNALVAIIFLGVILLLWIGIQLLAEKRLGFRKQGCKGPVPGEDGEMLCCKGDGSECAELNEDAQDDRERDT